MILTLILCFQEEADLTYNVYLQRRLMVWRILKNEIKSHINSQKINKSVMAYIGSYQSLRMNC